MATDWMCGLRKREELRIIPVNLGHWKDGGALTNIEKFGRAVGLVRKISSILSRLSFIFYMGQEFRIETIWIYRPGSHLQIWMYRSESHDHLTSGS